MLQTISGCVLKPYNNVNDFLRFFSFYAKKYLFEQCQIDIFPKNTYDMIIRAAKLFILLNNVCHDTGADGASAFAHGKA